MAAVSWCLGEILHNLSYCSSRILQNIHTVSYRKSTTSQSELQRYELFLNYANVISRSQLLSNKHSSLSEPLET